MKRKRLNKNWFIAIWSTIGVLSISFLIALSAILVYWDKPLTEYMGSIGGGIQNSGNNENVDTEYFKSRYKDEKALKAAQEEFAIRQMSEAAVLLKNENNALPLESGSKISLFGYGARGGSIGGGSGNVNVTNPSTLSGALMKEGFEINQTLYDFYANSSHRLGTGTMPGTGNTSGDWKIDETPWSEFTQDVKKSFDDFNDVAIVAFARAGGEGNDLPMEMSRYGGKADQHYLELDDVERELLHQVSQSGFKKTIVLIVAANAMELEFLDNEDLGIDGALWYAGTGAHGISGVAKIIKGDVSPSGRLVNTFVYDNFSSPVMQNFGDFRYVDKSGNFTGYSYMNYAESIYMGYRYYETRYEDRVMGKEDTGNYNYSEVVQFPFGYGLSYTDFSWSDFKLEVKGQEFVVKVTVENIGTVSSKEVVQIYNQSPYTKGGVEKASATLVGFAKTKELKPGEKEVLTISFDKSELASYDEKESKTYVFDAGDHYITAAKNAHQAVNNILLEKGFNNIIGDGDKTLVGKYTQPGIELLNKSKTGFAITNQFQYAVVEDFNYLSRSKWNVLDNNGIRYATGKKPGDSFVSDAEGNAYTIETDNELTNKLKSFGYDEAGGKKLSEMNYAPGNTLKYNQKNGMELIDLKGKEYNDPMWDDLLDQMKLSEQHILFNKSGYGMASISSINMPKVADYDGPSGISNMISGKGAYAYPDQIMLSATWNLDIAKEYGEFIAEDGLLTNTSGWYAPAVNLHRSPFSGRNFEYFSEDPVLSGKIGAVETKAVIEGGMYVYIKHFALNDQETNRNAYGSVAIWSTEQASRELYFKAFQYLVEDGGANGVMTTMSRIGHRISFGNYSLLTTLLRDEWGFQGTVITDYTSSLSKLESDQILAAGGDLILATAGQPLTDATTDWSRHELRRATKNALFNVVNSNAMNGFSHGTIYKKGLPVYMLILIIVNVLAVGGLALTGYGYVYKQARLTDEEWENQKRLSKKTKIIIWSIVGVILAALLIYFFVFLLPIILDALLV